MSPPTKQQRIYDALRERIVNGAYGPGFRLVIAALAAEHRVSALPVREAIRRLEAEGLVIYLPNVGAQVAPADPRVFEDQLSVVAVLDGYVTALSAPLLDAADRATLRNTTDRMESAIAHMDPLGLAGHDDDFHSVFVDRCPNQPLVRMLRGAERRLEAVRPAMFTRIPYRGAESVAEHHKLVELIERGARGAQIEDAARAHRLRTVESFRAWQRQERSRSSAIR